MTAAPTRDAVPRRTATVGALAAAALAGTAGRASADPDELGGYAPRKHKGAPALLSRADRHLVSRFSYGITPTLAKEVRKAGGAQRWFERQLNPKAIKDKKADKLAHWWPSFHLSPAVLWQRQRDGIEGGWEVMDDYARYVLMRRMTSRRQLLEVMTEFWENHLHVAASGDPQFTWRVDYGNTIRKHALGRFDDLLRATTTHPAMLIYLDAGESTKDHPNENLGRELLELHTVGVGNYSEKDVVNSARILTGYSVDYWKTWRPKYNADDHYRGKVKVKGFRDKNKKIVGKATTAAYLRYLARHKDTAQHLAYKLCVKFIDDKPSKALVRHLAKVYLDNDTAIVPVLRALVASPAFQHAHDKKVRDPGEDVVATYRVLGVKLAKPAGGEEADDSALQSLVWQADSIGIAPFSWEQPNGQPIDNESWSSPARLMASMRFHMGASAGWADQATKYRKPEQWLGGAHPRFDELVDRLCAELLHRESSKRLLKACCTAVDVKPYDPVDKDSDLVKWRFPQLLTTILDSPEHLSR
ncbi:MAG TPA: DUF1800 domain-containing protein [Nocardioides sp.]|uniref:DUF1800 domain-containing protein n=1 Tax=Nocardioides sp. TaxID=35761 RepID=UPI002E2F01C1|nr:DUF1800 domain-containing protein [Nocardioides sp.]HEX5089942.1 DUF1800 domain-containing protein [Nocardioides sp.]